MRLRALAGVAILGAASFAAACAQILSDFDDKGTGGGASSSTATTTSSTSTLSSTSISTSTSATSTTSTSATSTTTTTASTTTATTSTTTSSGGVCPGLTECSGLCTDIQVDNDNCGACGDVCPVSAQCAGGTCVCQAPTTSLCIADGGKVCVDETSDPDNCGSCGNPCTGIKTCQAAPDAGSGVPSSCMCPSVPAGLVDCGAGCTNANTDPLNCGVCGKVCTAGQMCFLGACMCRPGLSSCGPCMNYQTNPGSCGGCNKSCGNNSCYNGNCVTGCPTGTTNCAHACVDTTSDPLNCGVCGSTCTTNQVCVAGVCQNYMTPPLGCSSCAGCCPAGTTCCTILGPPACVNGSACPG